MMKSFMKATAALAVVAGSSMALAQPYCSSPELFLPDVGGGGAQDTINVTGGPAAITDLAITVNISHTWDGDVQMVLVHNGMTLNLSSGNGGGGDNFTNTRFIDTAATNIVFGVAPFTGDFQPEGGDPFWSGTISIPAVYLANCAGFFGGDGNGAWDLVFNDTAGGDTGTLHNWCIDFAPGAPPPPPPPPPGDDCSAPIIAVDGSNTLNTVDATTDSAFTCGFGVARDVHFTYTATADGVAFFSTCGSSFDTVMQLGTSCGANDLGCLDDSCGLQTTMSTGVTIGQVVHVTIGGYNGQSGTGTLDIVVMPPAPNDECLTATVLNGEGTFPFDNTTATTNGTLSCGAGGSTGFNDVWFEYIAGFTGDAFIETCGLTTVDTQLAVFDACGGNEITCNDDSCGTLQSKTLPFAVTSGTSYWVRLSGWGTADTGSGSMNIAQYVPPPPGDDCFQPFTVGDGVHAFDTTGTTNSYAGTCGASGGSPDIFFLWTVGADGCADIGTCGSSYDTVVEVIGSCGGPTIVCNDDSCGGTLQSQVQVPGVTAGQQLLVRVSGFNNQSGPGTLTLSVSPSNPYTHPSGTEEPEPCFEQANDTANGGCNSAPEIFGSISCGETVTGTSWYDGAVLFVRDTDSFAFTLEADATVTFTGQAEFPVQTFILNGGCPWGTFYAAANNSACGPDFTISSFLPAGSYNFWVGGSGAGGNFYCGGSNRYWATMSVDTGCAASCDGDVNCDFALDGFDVEVQERAVGGDLTDYCQPDADFNGDFALDGFDVEAVEIVVGGGPCP